MTDPRGYLVNRRAVLHAVACACMAEPVSEHRRVYTGPNRHRAYNAIHLRRIESAAALDAVPAARSEYRRVDIDARPLNGLQVFPRRCRDQVNEPKQIAAMYDMPYSPWYNTQHG